MAASPETRRRVGRLRAQLGREFPHVPAGLVDRLVDSTCARLLEQAHFQDFVPLLAHRYVREYLLAEGTGNLARATELDASRLGSAADGEGARTNAERPRRGA